ncbi:Uncharacterized membrane protein YkoI [Paracoccus halophilus]|uniref:Uncharacterized membrane protein YkoI n=1 Tax=Paracoccus halophilus TaxID=376733 RepID=A0A099F6P8_9RHOB|nr:hypothetical protein [Paracoccus halophilus]KGJ06129.1 hypothetical protein IT41_02930 [Paracoccus halophilus]SFA46136.1 Uncharacterized membrane protein YkoI [Paracoccus halophilus]
MNRLVPPLVTLIAALLPALPASAEKGRRAIPEDQIEEWAPELSSRHDHEFRVIPLRRAAKIVAGRFHGKLIGARLTGPTPRERDMGVVLVQELRLLTPSRDLLRIRLDARTGEFLEVAGAERDPQFRKEERK